MLACIQSDANLTSPIPENSAPTLYDQIEAKEIINEEWNNNRQWKMEYRNGAIPTGAGCR